MKIIMQLKARGLLTESQVLAAWKFSRAPRDFEVAPTFYRVLHDAIINEEPLEAMEKRRGWPARSAKAIIGLLLHALQEMGATHMPPEDEGLREQVAFLTATDDMGEVSGLMSSYGLTLKEARLLLILKRARDRELGRDILHARLYYDRPDDPPEGKIIDVMICKMRAKLQSSPWKIETVWGVGYRLTEQARPAPDPRWLLWYAEHVLEGRPLREVARRHKVHASTVLRAIRALLDQLDDDTLEDMARDALARRSGADGPPRAVQAAEG
jgi:DNA-binding MarR family transcriptional regulator